MVPVSDTTHALNFAPDGLLMSRPRPTSQNSVN